MSSSEITIKCFHTCIKNNQENDAPFLSENNNRQWLTPGYYFWTDSPFFAKKWGITSYGENGYSIFEYDLNFSQGELLDLVGNTEHQGKFFDFYNRLKKIMIYLTYHFHIP